jgi:hypothetical protein
MWILCFEEEVSDWDEWVCRDWGKFRSGGACQGVTFVGKSEREGKVEMRDMGRKVLIWN